MKRASVQEERAQVESIRKLTCFIANRIAFRYWMTHEDREDMEAHALSVIFQQLPYYRPELSEFSTWVCMKAQWECRRWRRNHITKRHLMSRKEWEQATRLIMDGGTIAECLPEWQQEPRSLDYRVDERAEPVSNAVPDPQAEITLHLLETQDWLQSGISQLRPQLRQVVYLRFFEGLSQQQVGKRMRYSQMQICRLERQALAALRERLQVPA